MGKKVIKKQAKVGRTLKVRAGGSDNTREGSSDNTRDIIPPAKRVIKDSPVRGKFSRSEIRAAVQAVARRHGAT